MESEKLIKPAKIPTKDICVAQLLYGGGGLEMSGLRAYEDKPYTLMVGYILNKEFFVDRFQRYIPLYKRPSILEHATTGSEINAAIEYTKDRDKSLKKGIYADKTSIKLAFPENLEEVDQIDIEYLLGKLEIQLYSNLSKYGVKDFTEPIHVEKNFLEDNSLHETLSEAARKR